MPVAGPFASPRMKRSVLRQLGGDDAVDFEALAEEAALAEELGLEAYWCFPALGEDGSFRGQAPAVWLAGLAPRTRRLRLGWGVGELLPPERPPLRVGEQAATLDVASEGRLDVALIPAAATLAEDWAEGLRMLVDMWDAPSFSWTSARFSVHPVDVVPKPVQKPHPPLRLAGWHVEHARAAGRGGLGYLDLSGAPDDALEVHRDAYAEARAEAEPLDLVSPHVFAVAADLAPDDAGRGRLRAWEELGVDEAIVRIGPLPGGHADARDRLRFLGDGAAEPTVH